MRRTSILFAALLGSLLLACDGKVEGNPGDGGPNIDAYIGSGELELDWVDNADNEDGFIVQRRTSGGSFAEIARPAANAVNFVDNGVDLGNNYCYRVAAYNAAGQSAFTPEGCADARSPTP